MAEFIHGLENISAMGLIAGALVTLGVFTLAFRQLYRLFEGDVEKIVERVVDKLLDDHDDDPEAHGKAIVRHDKDRTSHPDISQKLSGAVQAQADMQASLTDIKSAIARIELFIINRQWEEKNNG